METEQVEAKAREMGWRPKEEWHGRPDGWQDAETFVARGEEILPIVRSQNKQLRSEVDDLKAKLAEATTILQASQESIEALKELNSAETRKKMEEQKATLKTQLVAAKEAGDHAREVELEDQLDTHNAALREATKTAEPEPKKTTPKATEDPGFIAWKKENPWFGTETRKSSIAVAIATEMRADASYNDLVGKAFFDKVGEEVERTLGGGAKRPPRVTGGGGNGEGGGGSSPGQTFADLPQDAKDACNRTAARVVGDPKKGKAFATLSEYQKHYAAKFFAPPKEEF
jgi:hypothetical protein